MDKIEFLERTDHRNLKYNIDYLVELRMREYEKDLKLKRIKLRTLLDYENSLFEKDLKLLHERQQLENARKRVECINMMRLDKERANEEFLKAKAQQRAIENSQEVRHWESKQILLETKQSQLYQIAEKQALRQKEQEWEEKWWKVHEKMFAEKKRGEILEEKLSKLIAGLNQAKNQQHDIDRKCRSKIEAETLQQEHAKDDEAAIRIDQKYKEAEKLHNWFKKSLYSNTLQKQIDQNSFATQRAQELERAQEKQLSRNVFAVDVRALDAAEREKVRSRVWQDAYYDHAIVEKSAMRQRDKQLEDIFVGSGCVLAPTAKQPYSKEAR